MTIPTLKRNCKIKKKLFFCKNSKKTAKIPKKLQKFQKNYLKMMFHVINYVRLRTL